MSLTESEPSVFPDFVPKVAEFLTVLRETSLPPITQVRLMEHYEQTGEFGKAEDVFFDLLEAEPDNPKLVDFGISFYQRLKDQSDASLSAGNLPREEVRAGLAELQGRKAGITSGP